MRNHSLEQQIFSIKSDTEFNSVALEVFKYQAENCKLYSEFVKLRNIDFFKIKQYNQIPFLPISFFKTNTIIAESDSYAQLFESSKTTGQIASKHFVKYIDIYKMSFTENFVMNYGNPQDYIILALLPSYIERGNSSLVYMVKDLIEQSQQTESGFFINDFQKLYSIIESNKNRKILLLGVSFALLDFAEEFTIQHSDITIMETGGMKGKRKELLRTELHEKLCASFGVSTIHSEYGMTELLSQAYSNGQGLFKTPNWMKVFIRDVYDPFSYVSQGNLGAINVIDLANLYSCSFIETQDLGRYSTANQFTVEGRISEADVRGCNLMYS